MLRYILKRVLYMIFTLWVVITITFFLMHAMPGDPLASLARKLPEQIRINYYAKYGLDKSVPQQYVRFLKNVFHGDFGESLTYPGRYYNKTCSHIRQVGNSGSNYRSCHRYNTWNRCRI